MEVGHSIDAADAHVIDASGKIVMPGFIDTHHHQFETGLRSTLSDAIVVNDGRPENERNYYEKMLLGFSQHYRPQDVYINELYGGLAQLDAGVTTVMDVSQIHHSPSIPTPPSRAARRGPPRRLRLFRRLVGPARSIPAARAASGSSISPPTTSF
jgi:cytosine/adenosine deaminase-related metal-dependent hydrolase